MRDREAGFTLIEMIVVLVVLALAAGLVLARGPMRSASLDLRAAARTMAADMRTFFRWVGLVLTLPTLIWPARPFYRGALSSLRLRAFHMDVPIALAITAAFAHGVYNTWLDHGPIYFDGVTTLIFLLLCGRFLQTRAQRAAVMAVGSSCASGGQAARRLRSSSSATSRIGRSATNSAITWRQSPHGAAGSGPRVTITAATNARRPVATAWQMALRSAQIVPPKLAFSMPLKSSLSRLTSAMSAPNLAEASLESLEGGLKASVKSPCDTLKHSPPR